MLLEEMACLLEGALNDMHGEWYNSQEYKQWRRHHHIWSYNKGSTPKEAWADMMASYELLDKHPAKARVRQLETELVAVKKRLK